MDNVVTPIYISAILSFPFFIRYIQRSGHSIFYIFGSVGVLSMSLYQLRIPIISTLREILAKSDAASALALTVFTIITSLLVAYLLVLLSDFNSKREAISSRLDDLKAAETRLRELENELEQANDTSARVNGRLEFFSAKVDMFLKVSLALNDLTPMEHQRMMVLSTMKGVVSSSDDFKAMNSYVIELRASLERGRPIAQDVLASFCPEFWGCAIRELTTQLETQEIRPLEARHYDATETLKNVKALDTLIDSVR